MDFLQFNHIYFVKLLISDISLNTDVGRNNIFLSRYTRSFLSASNISSVYKRLRGIKQNVCLSG